jgi:hypothetical protein
VDVNDAVRDERLQPPGRPAGGEAGRGREVDEAGTPVGGEGRQQLLVVISQMRRPAHDHGGLGEGAAGRPESRFLLRRQHSGERGPVVASAAEELTEHDGGFEVEHGGRARELVPEQVLAFLLRP